MLHAGRPGLVEVVSAERTVDGRLAKFLRSDPGRFVHAGDIGSFLRLVQTAASAPRREVFFTPATLDSPTSGNDAVSEAAVAWVDIDEPRNLERLRAFRHRPHAVVASGSGGVHAYWLLDHHVAGDACEEINRKLASALGADPASCNRGRILRVPGTRNFKRARPGSTGARCRLILCDLASPGLSPEELVEGLEDPKRPRPSRRGRATVIPATEEPWTQMDPAQYYRAITGCEPPRGGRVRCPSALHEDVHPSAQLYPGPGSGWYCFSCGAGGSAPDLVAALRGWPTGRALAGDQFKECISELRRIFGVQTAAPEGRGAGPQPHRGRVEPQQLGGSK